MPDDHLFAARDLRDTWRSLTETRGGLHDQLARIGDLARLLSGDTLAARAADAVVAELPMDIIGITRSCYGWFVDRNLVRLKSLAMRAQPHLAKLPESLASEMRIERPWRNKLCTIENILADLRHGESPGLGEHDGETIKFVIDCITGILGRQSDSAHTPAGVRTALDEHRREGKYVNDDLARVRSWMATARASDLSHTLGQLRNIATAFERLQKAEVHGDRATFAAAIFLTKRDVSALVPRVQRLVDATAARLSSGPIRAHVVARLKTMFERWERDRILREISPGSTERELQREVDRFVFSEGLFPITHCEVVPVVRTSGRGS